MSTPNKLQLQRAPAVKRYRWRRGRSTRYLRQPAWQSAKQTHLQRLYACPPRSRLGSFPKTVSSTSRQYAATTFVSSDDSPLVTCISGPNSESVAVRLTII